MVLANDDYDGPILPGQRWRNRGVAGHQHGELLTVLRFNGRSVQIVYEGSKHKGGKRYGVPVETFRRNYNLVSQPPGYKAPDPEPAPVRRPAPKLTVGDYFRRRRWVEDATAAIMGEVTAREIAGLPPTMPVPPPCPSCPPRQEEPAVQSDQSEPADTPEATETPQPAEPAAVIVTAARLHFIPVEDYPEGTPPAPEVDPLDAFLDNGRAIVAGYDAQLAELEEQRRGAAELLAAAEAAIAAIAAKRARVDAGIQAAIAAVLDLDHPAPPAPGPESSAGPDDPKRVLGTVASANGTVRLRGASGYVPQPGKVSQKEWVLSRLPEPGGEFTIQGVVDAFAAEYGITREQAIKNVSSLLGYQTRDPKPEWPAIERVELGVYRVVERQPTA